MGIEGAPLFLAGDMGEIIPVMAIGGSFVIAIIWIVFGTVESVFKTRAREQTRREVAAYVAEGTMSPDDAERILAAGPKDAGKHCCGRREGSA